MALIKLSALVSEISGSLNGSTFYSKLPTSSLRKKSIPKTSLSNRATSIRSTSRRCVSAWLALSTANKQTWDRFLVEYPMYSEVSPSIKLTSRQVYMRLNKYISQAVYGFTSVPTVGNYYMNPLHPFFFSSAGYKYIGIAYNLDANYQLPIVLMSPPVSPSTVFKWSTLRNIGHRKTSFNYLRMDDKFLAKYGFALETGKTYNIAVSLLNFKTGYMLPFYCTQTKLT